jgi:hypothetical protein
MAMLVRFPISARLKQGHGPKTALQLRRPVVCADLLPGLCVAGMYPFGQTPAMSDGVPVATNDR